jgi:cytochrome c biogenesis protein CcdA
MGPARDHPGEETSWTPDRVMQGSALAVVSFCLVLVIAGGLALALVGRLDPNRWLEMVAGILTTLIGFVFGYLFRGAGGRSTPRRP